VLNNGKGGCVPTHSAAEPDIRLSVQTGHMLYCLTLVCRGQPALIDESSAVKVAVLVRPLLDFEGARGAVDIVQTPGPARIRLPSKPQPLGPVPQDADGGYTFDYDVG
jgi:hypothetical protein